MPRISVIIASYNHEKYVIQSIESVLQQTFQDFEIIITDDGSEDATVEQIRKIRDPRIKLFCFDVNQGACAATNNCIINASGEFVAVLNSDDFWMPNKLELQLNFIQQHPDIAAVFSNAQFVDEEGKDFPLDKRPAFFEIFEQKNRSQGQWLKRFLLEGNCLCHPSLLIRRECYNVLGLLDNRYRQLPDFDLWIRFCKKFKLHVMSEKLVRFRLLPEGQNASNQTKTNRIRDMNEFYFIMQHFFDDMPVEIFRDGFSEFVRNPDFESIEEYECEKAFVYLDCSVPWLAKCYRLIAFQKLYHMLSGETSRKTLKEKYSFDEKTFMALSASIDFLEPQPKNTYKNHNTEVESNEPVSISEGLTTAALPKRFTGIAQKIKKALSLPFKALHYTIGAAGEKHSLTGHKNILAEPSSVEFPLKPGHCTKKCCPICKTTVQRFSPMYEAYLKLVGENQFMYPLSDFETLNLDEYSCPTCGASDRDRLCALFIDLKFKELDKGRTYRFVEFAPSVPLTRFIRQNSFIEYRSADLFMEGVEDRIDLMDMKQYTDNSVDMFVCSHVLEHVSDDRRAMRELRRILKKDGWGIVMVPLLLTLGEVHEDAEIMTEADRWRYFGQNDHVRLYSKQGFIDRLTEVGFRVSQNSIGFFGNDIFEASGIDPRSVLYVVEK